MNSLWKYGISLEGFHFVDHELKIIRTEGLNLAHGVLGAMIERIRQNSRGSDASSSFHAIAYLVSDTKN